MNRSILNLVFTAHFIVFCLPDNFKAQIISGGNAHSLFICNDGIPRGCGSNLYGQLGLASTANVLTPISFNTLSGIVAVEASWDCSYFLKYDGTVWSCGDNFRGKLGDGTTTQRNSPVQVNSLTNIIAISSTNAHALFLKNDGTVWVCGSNFWGQLGLGTYDSNPHSIPVQIPNLNGIIAIAAGHNHSIFLKNDGTVWTCGVNTQGQLGIGASAGTIGLITPTKINTINDIIGVAAGGDFSLFLKNNGTVWSCGDNWVGQLGNGTTAYSYTMIPTQINTISNVKALIAGGDHSMFQKNDGTIWVCGSNSGCYGNGSFASTYIPSQSTQLNGILSMAAGERNSLFVKTDGSIWTCGDNFAGQLGDGSNTTRTSIVQVLGACSALVNIKENEINSLISLFPNPNNGHFALESYQDQEISILNILGQVVKKQALNSGVNEIEISEQPNGIYFLEIVQENKLNRIKIIKQD